MIKTLIVHGSCGRDVAFAWRPPCPVPRSAGGEALARTAVCSGSLPGPHGKEARHHNNSSFIQAPFINCER